LFREVIALARVDEESSGIDEEPSSSMGFGFVRGNHKVIFE